LRWGRTARGGEDQRERWGGPGSDGERQGRWEETVSGENGQRVVGRDRKWWEGIGCGEKGLGEVRRGVEIGRSGRGQGAVGRDRERWGRTGRDRER